MQCTDSMVVNCARYLGVDISSDLTWRSHVDRNTGSATKTLNFARRNIKTKTPGVREMAYNTLVRPQLEYAAAVWDPDTKGKTSQIEKVQRRAARWVSCNYVRLASVSVVCLPSLEAFKAAVSGLQHYRP